jgi:hypothetical protein
MATGRTIIQERIQKRQSVSIWAAKTNSGARLVHFIVHTVGIPVARTLASVLGVGATLVIGATYSALNKPDEGEQQRLTENTTFGGGRPRRARVARHQAW